MAEAAGVLYGLETALEGAVAFAKGLYDPTLPLKATITPIAGVKLPRAYHSVSVAKGRAYIFGGKSDNRQELADNGMHIVILPSSGVESADYKQIEPTSQAPPARQGHTAAVIDDRIYFFGGASAEGQPTDEQGRV